jgi:hypothetical protein
MPSKVTFKSVHVGGDDAARDEDAEGGEGRGEPRAGRADEEVRVAREARGHSFHPRRRRAFRPWGSHRNPQEDMPSKTVLCVAWHMGVLGAALFDLVESEFSWTACPSTNPAGG